MKLYLLVLIAAVTVNCLVTAINGETASDTLAVPYIDMLLPPLEDKAESSKADSNVKDKVKTVTTKRATITTTTTTKKPKTNDAVNNLPELSIEALLPPLFEAKTKEDETKETTTKRTTTTTTTTTTKRPTTTTRATTTTTYKPTTTTTTTLKPIKIEVPALKLEPLLPPLLDNKILTKDEVLTTTTQLPLTKTTKKSYYQQQQQQTKHLTADAKKDLKNFNVKTSSLDKQAAESKTQTKQVSLASKKLPSNIESLAKQHAVKQIVPQQRRVVNSHSSLNNDKQYNYSFNLFLGSTTPRPAKSGLPTITPFPRRLRR